MKMKVWAFSKVPDDDARKKVYDSIKSGKSRFGWSQKDEHNVSIEDNWDLLSEEYRSEWFSRQRFLLRVEKGDWIVHINTYEWDRCIAAQVISGHDFDGGLQCSGGPDFKHYFDVDIDTIVEFYRKDQNILSTVNLTPRKRCERVYAVEDFLQSIENLKSNAVVLKAGESKHEHYLKDKTEDHLSKMSYIIHKMHRGKDLEGFIAKVFRKIPGVVDVNENGRRGGADYGADLIVTMSTLLGGLELEQKIIVQIKSFEGKNDELKAVEQIATGIKRYEGDAGMIITTAERTEELGAEISKISDEIGKSIDLLASSDLVKFIIKHAPELLFRF